MDKDNKPTFKVGDEVIVESMPRFLADNRLIGIKAKIVDTYRDTNPDHYLHWVVEAPSLPEKSFARRFYCSSKNIRLATPNEIPQPEPQAEGETAFEVFHDEEGTYSYIVSTAGIALCEFPGDNHKERAKMVLAAVNAHEALMALYNKFEEKLDICPFCGGEWRHESNCVVYAAGTALALAKGEA